MANLPESAVYEAGIFQLEKTTPPLGGVPVFIGSNPLAGHANVQALQLANRTTYLKAITEDLDQRLSDLVATAAGIYPDTVSGLAATPNNSYFSVPSTDPNEYLILYQNVSGTAVEISRSPSTDKVHEIDEDLYRTKNHISGGGDLVLDSQSGQLMLSLGLKNVAASVWLVGNEEKLTIDTLYNRMNIGFDLTTKVNILDVPEGHSDKREYPEFQTLPTTESALLLGTGTGEVAWHIDTTNKKITTEYLFEQSVEQRPPTVFIDSPARIERNTLDPFYRLSDRKYQATATIARTGSNRYWAAWRADNVNAGEAPGNFAVLAYSDDNCTTVQEYGYLTYSPEHPGNQIVDPMLWSDPENNLWLFYGVIGNNKHYDGVGGSWAVICHNPNAQFPVWGQPFRLSYYGDPRRPIKVNGEWYIALDGWRFDAAQPPRYMRYVGPHIHRFDWRNKKLEHISQLPPNNGTQYSGFFETEFMQRADGSVLALLRWQGTTSQILYSISTDLMKTWTPWQFYDTASPSSSSRMWLGRSPSGRTLFCWNNDTVRRTLTVGLSEDEGLSYPYKIVVEPDPSIQVSYPIVAFGDAGEIFIIYDNGRTTNRQIRISKVVEQDIVAGTSVPVVNTVSDPLNP